MNASTSAAAYQQACNRYLDIQSIADLPERLRQTKEVLKEWERCFHSLIELAESGDPDLWYALGDAFNHGRGTQPDKEASIHWFRRAAEAGHTKSMVRLGLCLQSQGGPERGEEAIGWFHKAAEGGNASGMIWLGFAYRDGTNVRADFEIAAEWFIKAVEAGDGHSMTHVGRMYAYYLHSPLKAVECYLRAAEAGFTESHLALCMLYDDRKSDLYNPSEAVKWWHVVAEGTSSSIGRATVALARHYRDGNGTNTDPQTAKYWLQKNAPALQSKI